MPLLQQRTFEGLRYISALDALTGALQSPEDPRDLPSHQILGAQEAPYDANLLIEMPLQFGDAKSQGVIPRCTAAGLCNAMEMFIGEHFKGRNVQLNDADLWSMQGFFPAISSDLGDYPRSALRAARKFGVMGSDNSLWRITSFYLLNSELNDWIKANRRGYTIYTGFPTMVGMDVTKPDWTTWTFAREKGIAKFGGVTIGGHAICSRGLSAKDQVVYCRNSWGDQWGYWHNSKFCIKFGDVYRASRAFIFEVAEVVGGEKAIALNIRRQWQQKQFWKDKSSVQKDDISVELPFPF